MADLFGLFASAALACLVAPRMLGDFAANGWTRANWRGRELPFPAGAIAVAVSLIALGPLVALDELANWAVIAPDGLALVLGVAFLGLLDDLLDAPARGVRGHGRAVLRGGFSTGALKAVGTLSLALLVLAGQGREPAEFLLAVAVVVLSTNAFNLLDLRPGRAAKAFLLLGLALLAGTRELDPLGTLGVFVGPLLVLGAYDLRERAMLGDTGSNLLGALAGLWMVGTLDVVGQLAALAALVALTTYGELKSISRGIESFGPLRALDRLGRVAEPPASPAGDRPSAHGAGGS